MPTIFNYTQQTIGMRCVQTANLTGTYVNANGGFAATITATGNGALTVDSVTMNTGDYVLLTGQSNAYENGPYVITAPGSVSTAYALQRASFFLTPVIASAGTWLAVGAGTVNAGSIWVLVEPVPTNIGVDSITFVKA